MPTADEAIKIMEPFIVEGTYWICSIPNNSDIPKNSIATFKESMGLSVIIKQQEKPKYICTEPKAMINVGLDTPIGYEGFLAKLTKSLRISALVYMLILLITEIIYLYQRISQKKVLKSLYH